MRWTALELLPECKASLEAIEPRPEVIITDKFVAPVPKGEKPLHGRRFDVVFGNPPFTLASEFIDESLACSETVVMLLRLDFLASKKRNAFMQANTPSIFVIPDWPSFDGQGTDSNEYAWFVWQKGTPATVGVLDLTLATVKRKAKELHRKLWSDALHAAGLQAPAKRRARRSDTRRMAPSGRRGLD